MLGDRKMIDLHCHILPELDDGARSIGDSVAMARQAAEDGIEGVCATPHIRHDHDVHISEIAARVATLSHTPRLQPSRPSSRPHTLRGSRARSGGLSTTSVLAQHERGLLATRNDHRARAPSSRRCAAATSRSWGSEAGPCTISESSQSLSFAT